MVKFQIRTFHVNIIKQGYYLTLTGTVEGRENSMKCKKFIKKEKLTETVTKMIDGEIEILILGRREQSDFEKKHDLVYYDFQLVVEDW